MYQAAHTTSTSLLVFLGRPIRNKFFHFLEGENGKTNQSEWSILLSLLSLTGLTGHDGLLAWGMQISEFSSTIIPEFIDQTF